MDDVTTENKPLQFPSPALVEPAVHSDDPVSAIEQLRAFEDQHFGEDPPRINGDIERGHGSRYAAMTPEHRAHLDALVALVAAEKELSDASLALSQAEAKHEAAMAALADRERQVAEAMEADRQQRIDEEKSDASKPASISE
jgi:hypothetical protein